MKLMCTSFDNYPSNNDISSVTKKNRNYLPDSLLRLLDGVITQKNADVKKVAIGQALFQAARPRSVICPILLDIGVQMHRDFASRFIIDEQSSLDFSLSYDEVLRFVTSASMDSTEKYVVPSCHFTQFIAGNVDHNTATLEGRSTFHGMGIVMVTSGLHGVEADMFTARSVPRLSSKVQAAVMSDKSRIAIHFFESQSKNHLNKLLFKPLSLAVYGANVFDHIWSISKLFNESRTGWSGYMQVI